MSFNLKNLHLRLAEFPDQYVTTFKDGAYKKRYFPEVSRDVAAVIERLALAGIKPKMRIGLLAENCYEWLLFDLAICTHDCVSVAFPVEYAQRGMETLSQEYGLNLMVTTTKLAGTSAQKGLLLLDGPKKENEQVLITQEQTRPDEHTYIFSTGTAGKSKGMIMSAEGIAALIQESLTFFNFQRGSRMLVFMPLSAFQQRLFAYVGFYQGMSVLLSKPAAAFRAIRDLSPTVLIGPPALYEALQALGIGEQAGMGKNLCAEADTMLVGMAKIPPEVLEYYQHRNLPLLEVYGMTEAGVVCANTRQNNRLGSVGRPFPGVQLRISEEGEVLVKRNKPLAVAYFQPQGSLENPAYFEEWFPTGDMGFLDEDGFLTLSGRKDNLIVSSSGHKIQPEVLEQQLMLNPHIKRAVLFMNEAQAILNVVLELEGDVTEQSTKSAESSLAKLNAGTETWCKVEGIVFADRPFNVNNGLLNQAMKVDRKKVYQAFKFEIEGG